MLMVIIFVSDRFNNPISQRAPISTKIQNPVKRENQYPRKKTKNPKSVPIKSGEEPKSKSKEKLALMKTQSIS